MLRIRSAHGSPAGTPGWQTRSHRLSCTPRWFLWFAAVSLLFQSTRSVAAPEPAGTPTTAPAANPVQARKTIVFLGDSLSAGYGIDPTQAFPALIQKRLDEQKLPFTVVNAGVSGDTTAGGLRRIDWLLKRPVDILVLELGGNDGLRGIAPAATRTNLVGIIEKTRKRYPQAKIVLAGMQMPPNMGESFTRAFREIYPDLARQYSTALIPFLLEKVGGDPELNLPDMVHPTAKGHEIVAETVWKTLEPVVKEVMKAP